MMTDCTYEKCRLMPVKELLTAANDLIARGNAGEYFGEKDRKSLYHLIQEYKRKDD